VVLHGSAHGTLLILRPVLLEAKMLSLTGKNAIIVETTDNCDCPSRFDPGIWLWMASASAGMMANVVLTNEKRFGGWQFVH
jgi:hypothetical protein